MGYWPDSNLFRSRNRDNWFMWKNRVTHTQLNLNLKFAGKQDKQSNLPDGDWRDAIVVGWTLVLTVAGEKDAIDDGKNKKDEGRGCCGVPVDGDRGIVDGWEKEIETESLRNPQWWFRI